MKGFQTITRNVSTEWIKLTTVAQRLKHRPAFGTYGVTVACIHAAVREGLLELKQEREIGKVGPKTSFVRKVS